MGVLVCGQRAPRAQLDEDALADVDAVEREEEIRPMLGDGFDEARFDHVGGFLAQELAP